MKSVTKYISIALILAAGLFSSCRKDLTFSDSAADNQITVIATIANEGTKVAFDEEGTALKASWEATDNIVGWDEDGNAIELEVHKVDNGVAIFKPVSGSAAIPTSGKVYMIYAPGKHHSNISNKSLEYDLSNQNLTKVPALMTATGEVTGNVLSLSFRNELAIVAVKNPEFSVTAATTFSGLKISGSNINTMATFGSDDNGITVSPSAPGDITRSCTVESNSSGNTTATVYFAVLPNSTAADVKVSTVVPAGYQIACTGKSFEAGKCYLLNEKTFEKSTFTITKATCSNGSFTLSPDAGSIAWGETVTVTPSPASGYGLESIKWKPDGGEDTDITEEKSFMMPQNNVTVSVTFHPIYTEGSYSAPGIKIDNVWWAPVNCGYDETASPNGKLYQWGRKYGQAYESGDLTPSALAKDNDTEINANTFGLDYGNANWFSGELDNSLWNGSSKGTHDPCPAGWRVPTIGELNLLIQNYSSGDGGGLWFSGSQTYSESGPRIFFPANGSREYTGSVADKGSFGNYWSSSPNENNASYMSFDGGEPYTGSYSRINGYSVRCIKE